MCEKMKSKCKPGQLPAPKPLRHVGEGGVVPELRFVLAKVQPRSVSERDHAWRLDAETEVELGRACADRNGLADVCRRVDGIQFRPDG